MWATRTNHCPIRVSFKVALFRPTGYICLSVGNQCVRTEYSNYSCLILVHFQHQPFNLPSILVAPAASPFLPSSPKQHLLVILLPVLICSVNRIPILWMIAIVCNMVYLTDTRLFPLMFIAEGAVAEKAKHNAKFALEVWLIPAHALVNMTRANLLKHTRIRLRNRERKNWHQFRVRIRTIWCQTVLSNLILLPGLIWAEPRM
ncbi:hypothetical protein J3F83DRAFT_725947 [Trichoderma novae-zelandiae]